jgi:hypothetical protein
MCEHIALFSSSFVSLVSNPPRATKSHQLLVPDLLRATPLFRFHSRSSGSHPFRSEPFINRTEAYCSISVCICGSTVDRLDPRRIPFLFEPRLNTSASLYLSEVGVGFEFQSLDYSRSRLVDCFLTFSLGSTCR